MEFGATNEGFSRKRLVDIKTDTENRLRVTFGNQINLLPESVFGQLVGVFSERESELWEAFEIVFNNLNPNSAMGVALDNIAAITGITRNQPTPSVINGVLAFGTPGTVIPSGTQFSVQGSPTTAFQTISTATIGTGQSEVQEITFSSSPDAGTFRINYRNEETQNIAFDATSTEIESELTALSFGAGIEVSGSIATSLTISFNGDSGLQEQPILIIDDNQLTSTGAAIDLEVSVITQGFNQASIPVSSIDDGPIVANAGTLLNIDTPVGGLFRIVNTSDATPGTLLETDTELRARRESSLQSSGSSTPEAIRSTLLTVPGVTSVSVFENETNIVDLDGRPPKSYEALVIGGSEQEILNTVFATKPAGIETFGNITGQVADSQGQVQVVSFSRATLVPIFVEVDVTVNPVLFPGNGLASIEQAIVNRGNEIGIGNDVIISPTLICALDSIPGILSVVIRAGLSANPTGLSNIAISEAEVPVFETVNTTARII